MSAFRLTNFLAYLSTSFILAGVTIFTNFCLGHLSLALAVLFFPRTRVKEIWPDRFLDSVIVVLRPASWGFFLAAVILQVYCTEPAWAQENLRLMKPLPTSAEKSLIPLDVTFTVPPPAVRPPTPLRRRWQKQLEKLPPFFRDTELEINPRTFYLYRDNLDRRLSAAWAVGGSLRYQSGYLLNHVAIGAVGYTSNRLYGPLDRDGTELLKLGQKNINVLGQLYGKIKVTDNSVIYLFRREYNTPYINADDARMIPHTYEAYVAKIRIGDLRKGSSEFRFGGGYFARMKRRDSSTFISMSRAAGARGDRGVSVVMGIFETKNFSFGAINYYSKDLINIFYTESKVNLRLKNGLEFQLAGQFTDQESTGDNLLLNRPFSSRQFGIRWKVSYQGALLTLAYTNNTIGRDDLQSNWGLYPGYTGTITEAFRLAGEQAFMILGTYDFSRLGLKGLEAYALWTRGWGRINSTTRQPLPNADEINVDLQWKPESGFFKDLWLRFRYIHSFERGVNKASDQFRLIVNYRFPVL